MAEGGLASGWGEAVAEALADAPPSPEDIQPFSEVVASGAPPPNFVDAYDGYLDDVQDESGSATVGISREQWMILVLTHIPLIMLWAYALLGVFERASIAARSLSRSFGKSRNRPRRLSRRRRRRDAPLVAGEYQHPDHPHRRLARPLPDELPYVCVQLPMYNEPAVARRIIDAACLLRWPRDLLEIQVLEDSDAEVPCRAIVDTTAAAWRERGLMCNVVRRTHRRGFKAGALEAGRKKTAARTSSPSLTPTASPRGLPGTRRAALLRKRRRARGGHGDGPGALGLPELRRRRFDDGAVDAPGSAQSRRRRGDLQVGGVRGRGGRGRHLERAGGDRPRAVGTPRRSSKART